MDGWFESSSPLASNLPSLSSAFSHALSEFAKALGFSADNVQVIRIMIAIFIDAKPIFLIISVDFQNELL
jgi:hypothetical protein